MYQRIFIMLLTIQNLKKSFAATTILENISATLDKQDRVGIIGENGAGKTTLIKLIIGEYPLDEGEISFARGTTLGYLEQNSVLDNSLTVYGEMQNAFRPVLDAMQEMKTIEENLAKTPQDIALLARHAQLVAIVDAADGYNMDTQIKKILNGMAFPAETYDKSVSVLSGGEHTRLCLAKLLLQKPDILILDEPTNHLDVEAKEELKRALQEFKGTVLLVSHEPEFYEGWVTDVWNVEGWTTKIV